MHFVKPCKALDVLSMFVTVEPPKAYFLCTLLKKISV